jgi:hypothetical protein
VIQFVRVVIQLLVGRSRSILELSDQKAQGFLVLIALKRMLFERAHHVFGEMAVRI